jgi:DNA-binding transcriptional MocR family regulator
MAGSRTIHEVRRAILGGEWKPGAKLQPRTLAERFGTSTTVVREALTRLAGDGLVTTRRNRGFFVPGLNLRELSDITKLRHPGGCTGQGRRGVGGPAAAHYEATVQVVLDAGLAAGVEAGSPEHVLMEDGWK